MQARFVLLFSMMLLSVAERLVIAEDDFSEPEAEDFAYPVTWLKTGAVKDRMKFAFHRNTMLKAGWEGEPKNALAKARGEFEAARKLCKDDPRVEYAYGLVLWKHNQRDDAIKQFDAAARLNEKGPAFLPAAQAAAWCRLLSGQRESCWKQIAVVATVLSKSQGTYPTIQQKEDSALFLGRGVEFLLGPGSTDETATDDKRRATEISELIPASLVAEFRRGREQIDMRHADLIAMASRPAAEVEGEFQKRIQELTTRRDDLQGEIKKLIEEMDTRARGQKLWLKEQQPQIAQREQAIPQLQFALAQAARSVNFYSVPQKHYEVILVEEKTRDEKGKTQKDYKKKTVERPETPVERNIRLQNLAAARSTSLEFQQNYSMLVTQLKQLKDDRAARTKTYASEMTELRKYRTQKYSARRELDLQLKRVQRDYESPETLKEKVGQIASYVPWDPDTECDGLLASYRLTSSATSMP